MADKKYGEFDNFEDFFQDILSDLDGSPEEDMKAEEPAGGSAPDAVREPAGTADAAPPAKKTEARRPRGTRSDRPAERAGRPGRDGTGNGEAEPEADAPAENAAVRRGSGQLGRSVMFLLVLGIVTAVAWAIPLRPTASVSEKRNLERFPSFSFSTLLSGEYFKSIDNWFSDTFTFRESWIGAADGFKKIYGIKTVAIFGDVPVADTVPIPAPAAELSEAAPAGDDAGSAVEGPSAPEEVSAEGQTDPVLSEEDKEEWKGIVIDEDALIEDVGAKIQIGGSIFSYPWFNKTYSDMYVKLINKTGDMLEGKAGFYCILVPHNVTSMLSKSDREKIGLTIEEDTFEYIYGLMNSSVVKVNVISNLQKHNDEYIAFRSDPHWTALGAYYAYDAWCNAAGKEPVPLSEYKEIAWEDFFGTYYYTAGKPKEITNNPDIVYAYEPPGDVHLYIDYYNGLKLGTETDLLLDRSTRKVDQYITFLGTDKAKATFINNSIDDDSAVLVLKTSYGNPFVYYLTQHYHYVYVVDIRYYNYSISRFMQYNKVDDVILIHLVDMCYSNNGYSTVSRLMK